MFSRKQLIAAALLIVLAGAPSAFAGQPTAEAKQIIASFVEQIVDHWVRPPSARNGMVTHVLVRISRDGRVETAEVSQSSGDSAFDQAAVQAIREVGSLPQVSEVDTATYEQTFRERTVELSPEGISG
ncbi:energy transducer TonB [Pseudomonas sp. GV071]|uniref:energy transducer TonB n=1 Tax=Pseudomonas sp. GV071 TaxID=2135754 RepID=UPI000D4E8F4D|nr:energy transducer TonB [Pseudomonas sp. GV071]PTQ69080.1 TolA protein [Pseudomonas sp. GV071]